MSDITQFNPDDLIRQRMEYATGEHAKLLVVNADLRTHIEELTALLKEAADDIAQTAHDQHPYRDEYPDQMRRWKRDMDLPNRIRAALQEKPDE